MSRADDEAEWLEILDLAVGASGVDLRAYKPGTMERRIRLRAALAGAATLADYARELRRNAGEMALLLHAVLIKTTWMFRDPLEFATLRELALPRLVSRRIAEGASVLRAWVPCCATGEEAMSVAMCLREATHGTSLAPSVIASDVDPAALEQAARAIYPRDRTRATPPELAARWLHESGGSARVDDEIRALVTTARHDLLGSPYPAPQISVVASFDLVSCRNFFIYLREEAQEQVTLRLRKVLSTGGLLMLGQAETFPRSVQRGLAPIAPGSAIHQLDGDGS